MSYLNRRWQNCFKNRPIEDRVANSDESDDNVLAQTGRDVRWNGLPEVSEK